MDCNVANLSEDSPKVSNLLAYRLLSCILNRALSVMTLS